MTVAKTTALVGAVLAGALTLSGCAGSSATDADASSASSAPASPTPTPTPTPSPTASAGQVGADGGGDAGAKVAARDQEQFSDDTAVATPCVDEQLRLVVEPLPDESGAGSFGFQLVFTNASTLGCTFDGWPGLIAIDAAGAEVGWPAYADASPSALVVLAADGGVATAHVRGSQAGAFGCTPIEAAGLRARITSDGAGAGIDAPYAITVCDGQTSTMTISPLVAG